MSNPLFYRQVVALNTEAHRGLKLAAVEKPLAFAGEANFIPALAEEFAAAAADMPVAFLPGTPSPAAVFVTGFSPGQNLFVGSDGKWRGSYVPAYVRRYPFIMGDVPEGDPILCIDESFAGLGREDGELLLSPEGKALPPLVNALTLAENYRTSAQRTEEFVATLQRLQLFRSVTLDAKAPDGKATVVHGLLVVDEQAFDALGDAELLDLHRKNFIKPIFAHLMSLASIARLGNMMRAAEGTAAPAEA